MQEKNHQWLSTMKSLENMHHDIVGFLSNKKVAYIDIPAHFNVGDLLIYLGTESFFKKNNINVVYRSLVNRISMRALENTDVIVFHGGGNFGDIYTKHQKLRERIVIKFQNKMIICLPQTVHFESEQSLATSASIFSKHPNFHFYVRDLKSLETAKRFTDKAKLMPDMAHSLHPLVDITEVGPTNSVPKKILSLVRRDIESTSHSTDIKIQKCSFDWSDLISLNEITISRAFRFIRIFKPKLAFELWHKNTQDIAFKAYQYFNHHDIIHTDRLHGLILASLLGKEVMMHDNNYGKNSSYYDCWLKGNPFITKA